MTQTITAVYENGILRPLTPLVLPEHSQVEIEVRSVSGQSAPTRRERARLALVAAGLLVSDNADAGSSGLLTAEQRLAFAQQLDKFGNASVEGE
jgi:predicted DNA-binding antitoxin AbrB/MazE fold protein